jgi:chloramphenicol 3-O phosphotransferase
MQKLAGLLLGLSLISGCFTQPKKQSEAFGTIIILNGPSASGKSSLQKAFQKIADQPCIKIGIDNFFDGVMPENIEQRNTQDYMTGYKKTDEDGKPIFGITIGNNGEKVMSGMIKAIAAYAKAGNNIIVDYIMYNDAWLKELITTLHGFRVYLIGIKLPLEVLEQREKARATSPVGHARSHYNTVHNKWIYDLEIDTSKLSSEEAAQEIKEFIATHKPKAMSEISA